MEAHPLYGALSLWGLLDPVVPAYNQSWSDDRLILTASTFNRLWAVFQRPGHSNYCHTELAASFSDFLHYCSPSSGFCGAAKDNRGRHTDNSSGSHPIQTVHPPISIVTHFWLNALSVAAVPVYPAWYRHQIMLACIPGGLVCIFSLVMWIYEYHKSAVIVQYCLLIWCKFWPFAATAFLLQRVYVILVWVLYVCSINCFSVCRCWDSQILF